MDDALFDFASLHTLAPSDAGTNLKVEGTDPAA